MQKPLNFVLGLLSAAISCACKTLLYLIFQGQFPDEYNLRYYYGSVEQTYLTTDSAKTV